MNRTLSRVRLSPLLLFVFLLACGDGGGAGDPADRVPSGPQVPEDVEYNPLLGVDLEATTRTESGLHYQVLTGGEGRTVESGDRVRVHYTGWLADGRKFDSSRDRGEPATFNIGVGDLIAGWDEGIPGMLVGERRLLIVPSELAYGERGRRSGIPPHSVLVFDIELIEVIETGLP